MAQQINLYSPILLTPKRYFSALAIVQSLGLLVAGLVAFGVWSTWSTVRLQADLGATGAANEAEKARLAAELAQRPVPPKDTAALEQQVAQLRGAVNERRQVLDALDSRRGGAGHGNAELLRLLAQTAPAALWLTEVKHAAGRIEIAGVTLQPEALRPWLARLAEHPLLADAPLRAVKVERSDDPAAGAEAWSFRVVSGRANGDPT
jgi:Tfp pilus assembly protein PilN